MAAKKSTAANLELPLDDTPITPQERAEKQEYRQRLQAFLEAPASREIEGFPIGDNEAILALSDPPYYTACPNPFLGEILESWQAERETLRADLKLPQDDPDTWQGDKAYNREPYASDVSEGKNTPIYNAHSYHTKVPHRAIMRYILHYTDPGDIVLDGFCGTGMTGVAAQLCGDKQEVQQLGYRVERGGKVLDEKGEQVSLLGARKAVLVDLSPAATFIAYNYNTPVDARAFEREANRILKEVEEECGWMYETWHPHCDDPRRVKGRINYTVWSDVFVCPHCGAENVFWEQAVDQKAKSILDTWDCPGCGTKLAKSPRKDSGALRVERAMVTVLDRALGETIRQAKQVPVLINYSVGTKRFEKTPDAEDLTLIGRIDESEIPYPFPINKMEKGDKTSDPLNVGISHVHHFYTRRNLWTLATVLYKSNQVIHSQSFKFWLTASLIRTSKMYKFTLDRKMGTVSGTLYIPSLWVENVPGKLLKLKTKMQRGPKRILGMSAVSTGSSSECPILVDSLLDYIFVDPPFGANLMYSELNLLWEGWLGLITNNRSEAIANVSQSKGLPEYQNIMEACFREFYRLLKPGRWMTVEFHNSKNAVWIAIQEALLRSGFVVADVRSFDKQQGSFNQVNAAGAVKQDLIISAYKLPRQVEEQFLKGEGSAEEAWHFVRQHLARVTLPQVVDGVLEPVQECMPFLLYDRMVAFHIQRGLTVPLSAAEFYQGLRQRFNERDGMFFTSEQSAVYDQRRQAVAQVGQLPLFVNDEKSAIQWIRQTLLAGPLTYGDLQPYFVRELHKAVHEALPELMAMLEENFLQDEHGRWYVPDPTVQSQRDALRQKSLLREFGDYTRGKQRLKVFRSEAVRAGFSHAWKERDYETIVKVAERLPESVLQEDQQLLMYYHNAALRLSHQPRQLPLT